MLPNNSQRNGAFKDNVWNVEQLLASTFPSTDRPFCVNQPQAVQVKHSTYPVSWCLCDQRSTGSRLLLSERNLHLINTEPKSIVILIKDTGHDSPLSCKALESGSGFNFPWFSVSGSASAWIVCSDTGNTADSSTIQPLYSLQCLQATDFCTSYLAVSMGLAVV